MADFYVYTHARPDGSIFYVGKGTGRRAWDFSPKRRTAHHRNVAMKYGLRSIIVVVTPCATEEQAFAEERRLIAALRARGVALLNLTEGGEGRSGRPMTEKSRAAFAKARGLAHYNSLSEDAKTKISAGLARGREKGAAWRASPEGQAFVRTLGARSAAAMAARPTITIICERCDTPSQAKFARTRFCQACSKNGARDMKARLARECAAQSQGPVPPETECPAGGEGSL